MKKFKMNIHNGLSFNVTTETMIETYNLSNENSNSEKMYVYYVLSEKIDEDSIHYENLGDIKNRNMELKTNEGVFVIHRFASLTHYILDQFIRQDLNAWFIRRDTIFKRMTQNRVEVNYLKEASCLDCQIFEFSHFTENF
jgi:hypothetical protein